MGAGVCVEGGGGGGGEARTAVGCVLTGLLGTDTHNDFQEAAVCECACMWGFWRGWRGCAHAVKLSSERC